MIVLFVGLGIGVLGYHVLDGLSWIDSLLNASMILGGMGPVDRLSTALAKWLAGLYALFSGLVFIVVAGRMIGPLLHAVLHHFHIEKTEGGH